MLPLQDIKNFKDLDDWIKNTGKALAGELASTDTKIELKCEGYAAFDEDKPKGKSKDRANNIYDYVLLKIGNPPAKKNSWGFKKSVKGYGKSRSSTTPGDISNCRVDIIIENDSVGGPAVQPKPQEGLKDLAYYPQQAQIIDNLIINECNYFDFIDGNYPNYFQSISEKIKYFQPGYHSTTPEGLNSRLTFLHQCMRQGPSVYDDQATIQPQNLAFGRPPICILRIGDFFYTKIAINSMTISYDGGGSMPKWDLNPEGIGVQPMIADINLSIDIIGGQSLMGPINRLQNAVSFNYYGNTEMYDPRADFIKADKGFYKIEDGLKLGSIKKGAGVDLKKLNDSLKKEGTLKEDEDSKTGSSPGGEGPDGKIIIKGDVDDIIVTWEQNNKNADTAPAKISINGKVDPSNLMVIKIEVERKGIGFKTTIKEEVSDTTKTFTKEEWGLSDKEGESKMVNSSQN